MRLFVHFRQYLFIATFDNVTIVDVNTGAVVSQLKTIDGKGLNSPIVAMTSTEDGSLIFAAYADKWCCCWDRLNCKLISAISIHKRPTSLAVAVTNILSEKRVVLLAADKAGEVWACPVPSLEKSFCIIGHTASVLTDMIVSKDNRFTITSDRDEKIRVSHFPQTVRIETYCLGHSSVITSIEQLRISQNIESVMK